MGEREREQERGKEREDSPLLKVRPRGWYNSWWKSSVEQGPRATAGWQHMVRELRAFACQVLLVSEGGDSPASFRRQRGLPELRRAPVPGRRLVAAGSQLAHMEVGPQALGIWVWCSWFLLGCQDFKNREPACKNANFWFLGGEGERGKKKKTCEGPSTTADTVPRQQPAACVPPSSPAHPGDGVPCSSVSLAFGM